MVRKWQGQQYCVLHLDAEVEGGLWAGREGGGDKSGRGQRKAAEGHYVQRWR